MEIEELNRHLQALSSSERGYRDGSRPFKSWAGNQIEMIDGRTVYRLDLNEAPTANSDTPAHTRRGENHAGAYVPPGKIAIRRNSRFNPVPEHVHTVVEMSYVYAGTCPQTVNGKDVLLKEDQVLLLDTDCPHSIAALGEHDIMISIVLSRGFLEQNLMNAGPAESSVTRFLVNALANETDHRHYIRFHSQGNHRVRLFFQELMCEYLDPSPNAESIELALFHLIMLELINVYEADYTRRDREARRVSVIPIIRYIEQNYLTCTQEAVAERFFISPNYVSTLLKRHTGMTYLQLVQAQRLGRAASLLRQSMLPVEQVSRQVGYENVTFFYKKFKKQFGCLPGEYREQHRA